LHSNEVQTPAVVPDALSNLKSIKFPAGIETDPVAGQLPEVEGVQLKAVSAIELGVPVRSVTFTLPDCCEYTSNRVAVQPNGTHASTDALSLMLPFGVFTA